MDEQREPQSSVCVSVVLESAIEAQDWEGCSHLFREHPELCMLADPQNGCTPLHVLCSLGGSPVELIDLVASLNSKAISQKELRFRDTCLHIVCRNSQLSSAKLRALLKYCSEDDVLIRNLFGATPLHSAANHNADISALEALKEANADIARITTFEGLHAVTALWMAFIQTIPGHMAISRILEGDQGESRLFHKFWTKVEYLSGNNEFIAHRLLKANVPINFFKVCLRTRPECAFTAAATGEYPLHVLLNTRPYRLKEKEAIQACLAVGPKISTIPNADGFLPLQLAIQNKIPVNSGIDLLLDAFPESVRCIDDEKLFPFQQAALVSGAHAVETAFALLRRQPDLIDAIQKTTTNQKM